MFALDSNLIHLGLGATAEVEPEFTGEMSWYGGYTQRHANDGVEGRLVAMHSFTEPWEVWEMHPLGSEVVVCTAGEMTLHQELPDGTQQSATISAGEYAINAPASGTTPMSPTTRLPCSSPPASTPNTAPANPSQALSHNHRCVTQESGVCCQKSDSSPFGEPRGPFGVLAFVLLGGLLWTAARFLSTLVICMLLEGKSATMSQHAKRSR